MPSVYIMTWTGQRFGIDSRDLDKIQQWFAEWVETLSGDKNGFQLHIYPLPGEKEPATTHNNFSINNEGLFGFMGRLREILDLPQVAVKHPDLPWCETHHTWHVSTCLAFEAAKQMTRQLPNELPTIDPPWGGIT